MNEILEEDYPDELGGLINLDGTQVNTTFQRRNKDSD
jgi:hypothetical protein